MKMRCILKKFSEKIWLDKPEFVFILSLLAFVVDNVVNMFGRFPVFSLFSLLIIPLLFMRLWAIGKLSPFMFFFTSVFVFPFLITGFIYGFSPRGLSDLIFILFFCTSFFYYRANASKILPARTHVFPVMIVLLFGFAFAGINSQSFNRNKKVKHNVQYESPKKIKHDQDALDVLEYKRSYKNGLFRIPHVAAYFLGFVSLFYAFLFTKKRKWYYLVFSLLFVFLMLYSGVRTFAAAMFLATIFYFVRKKTLWIFTSFLVVVVLMFIFRYKLFALTQNTVLYPFSSLLITLSDNIDRLSRVLIWKSWWLEMQKFHWYDFLIGKSFYASIKANANNLHNPLWFHNDFFSIVFSYGIIAVIAYIYFYIKIFKEFSREIRQNIFLFVFFFSMPLAAFINGMYYYFPVLILYLFFTMLRLHAQTIAHKT